MKTGVALSIAGSDPSGGAGLQVDLKVFQHFSVYGMGLISLHTVQNSQGVFAVENVGTELLERQLNALLEDILPTAIKLGALGSLSQIELLSAQLKKIKAPLVIDPVFSSSSGHAFLDQNCVHVFIKNLLPLCYLITPNIPEAEKLSGVKIIDLSSLKQAAKKIALLGARNVLIKGGHLESNSCTDLLFSNDEYHLFKKERITNKEVHGTGCALSAAITAELAKGTPLNNAVELAVNFVGKSIQNSRELGKGSRLMQF